MASTTDKNTQILQTLTTNGFIAKGVTIDQITAASRDIVSAIGDKAADWTFISHNYVYTGSAVDKGTAINVASHANVMKALATHGVISKTLTLDQIVAASSQIAVSGALKAGDWTFISPNYVYKGGSIAPGGVAVNPAAR